MTITYSLHLTRENNELLSPQRNSAVSLTLPFAFPDEPSHDLIERSGDAQSLAVAPDRSVNRVYLGAPPVLQILQHRALVIIGGRDEVTIEQRAIPLHTIPQELDSVCFGHKEGLADEPIHNLP